MFEEVKNDKKGGIFFYWLFTALKNYRPTCLNKSLCKNVDRKCTISQGQFPIKCRDPVK